MGRSGSRWRVLVCGVALLAAVSAWAGPRDLVIVRPGGAAPGDEAQEQVGRLIDEIAAKAGWPAGSAKAVYFNREADALALIAEDKPGFVLTSPGFYLAHREDLNLRPINRVLIDGADANSYYVVARKGTLAGVDDLRGKTLAGAPLEETAFVERIVLAGRFRFGEDLTVQPMPGLRALRKLSTGEVDAVVLDATEYKAMAALPFAGDLATIFTSEPVPATGLMALGGVCSDADAAALAKATESFCEQGEGKAICETYGMSGFAPASAETYRALVERYSAGGR